MFLMTYHTETSMSPRDPRFLGAWWLGFVVFGVASLVFSVPVLFFPARFMKSASDQTTKDATKARKLDMMQEMKDLLKNVGKLLSNPIYDCLVLGMSINALASVGMASFMPKYLETQFNIPPSQSNITLGLLSVTSALLGATGGGWVASRFKMSPVSCLKLVVAALLACVGVTSLGFVLGCKNHIILDGSHGSDVLVSSDGSLLSSCVQDCHCNPDSYLPVCSSDGRNYFSPCQAGCLAATQSVLTNCTCTTLKAAGTAQIGLCTNCHSLNYLLATIFFSLVFGTSILSPMYVAIIRFVNDPDKPLALGVYSMATSIIGFFLGPIIFGSLIDTTCLRWRKSCASVGACAHYDIELFRFRYFGLGFLLRMVSLVFLVTALLMARYRRRGHDINTLVVCHDENTRKIYQYNEQTGIETNTMLT